MTGHAVIAGMIGLLFVCGRSASQPTDSLFTRGIEAYRVGEFSAAVTAYEAIVSSGQTSAEVYYNLGNAHFRAGHVGPAILAYERAKRLDPTDEDIRHNLGLSRLRTVDRIDPLPELFIITWIRWLNATIPVGLTTTLFLAGWSLLFVSLALMYLVRSYDVVRMMRWSFFGGSVLGILFGVLLLLQVLVIPDTIDGIIMSPTVTAMSSPDTQSVDAFVVHEGLRVTLGDSVEGWVRITLADGKTGWVMRSDVEEI